VKTTTTNLRSARSCSACILPCGVRSVKSATVRPTGDGAATGAGVGCGSREGTGLWRRTLPTSQPNC
jgi:hypothetical protein